MNTILGAFYSAVQASLYNEIEDEVFYPVHISIYNTVEDAVNRAVFYAVSNVTWEVL